MFFDFYKKLLVPHFCGPAGDQFGHFFFEIATMSQRGLHNTLLSTTEHLCLLIDALAHLIPVLRPRTNHIDVVVCGQRVDDGLGHRLGNVEFLALHTQTTIDDNDDVLWSTRRRNVPVAHARIVVVVEAGEVRVPFARRIESHEARTRAEVLPSETLVFLVIVLEHVFELFRIHDRVYCVLIVARDFVRDFYYRLFKAHFLLKKS